jgi:uncharacterized protein
MNDHTPEVHHRPHLHRFECLMEGQMSVCEYRLADGVMLMTHTEVPVALEGRGIAAALVRAALAHAEREGLKVRPLCSYVGSYMRRHPETESLRA